MKIYIIRHGETELNKQGLMQGITDAPLNASGREIAEISGRNMRGIRFDACVSSPLCRARETAEIILRESGNGDVPVAFDEVMLATEIADVVGPSPAKGTVILIK